VTSVSFGSAAFGLESYLTVNSHADVQRIRSHWDAYRASNDALGGALLQYYTIPNVNSSNNNFYFSKDKEVVIPEESYELREKSI